MNAQQTKESIAVETAMLSQQHIFKKVNTSSCITEATVFSDCCVSVCYLLDDIKFTTANKKCQDIF
jgi:hypothetical protein